MTGVLRRGESGYKKTDTWTKMEAEIQGCSCKPRNIKDCWPLPVAGKKQGKILPYRFQREQGPAGTLMWDFKPSKLYISVALSHFVCGIFVPAALGN